MHVEGTFIIYLPPLLSMIRYTVNFTCIQSLHVGKSNFGVGDVWHIFATNIFTDKHKTKWHTTKMHSVLVREAL